MQIYIYLTGLRIAPRLQLLVALRYMATGNFQLTLGDCADMSQSSVSMCLRNVSAAIAQLATDFIKFTTPENENELMQKFSRIAGMPGVIGCVDGTHIPILSPGGPTPELYRCRKGFFSMNVMAVCDPSLKFTNLVVNWPGSAHDSRVFSATRLAHSLESGMYRGFLLGDSGYACRSYLLTPFLAPGTDKERRFNASHIKTRNLIERAFGLLKRRFAVLAIPVRTKLSNTQNIVMACAVLHNIAVMHHLPLDEGEDVQMEDNEIPQMAGADNVHGQTRRANIVDRFF